MTTLYLAWRQPDHRWWPVGQLTRQGTEYVFCYTKGALSAEKAGFRPLLSFPDRDDVYVSAELFPLFANRLLPTTRPGYGDFVQWLDLGPDTSDVMVLLARSGGRRATDMFEVFAAPEPDVDGRYRTAFFVHGLRHRPPEALERALRLARGEHLLLKPEPGNVADPAALQVLTGEGTHLGFVPRYLCDDLRRLHTACGDDVQVSVRRVNPPPTPLQFRVLCGIESCWPAGFRPFSIPDFEPLHELTSVAMAGSAGSRSTTG